MSHLASQDLIAFVVEEIYAVSRLRGDTIKSLPTLSRELPAPMAYSSPYGDAVSVVANCDRRLEHLGQALSSIAKAGTSHAELGGKP